MFSITACEDVDLSAIDAGVELDAGEQVEKDAGFSGSDAGNDVEDGGVSDAGSSCSVPASALPPYSCVGTDDICDDLGDAIRPTSDILAVSSSDQDGSLALTFRYAAIPFVGPDQTLSVWLRLDDIDSNDDVSGIDGLPAADYAAIIQAPMFPPQEDTILSLGHGGAISELDACASLALSSDRQFLRAILSDIPADADLLFYAVGVSAGDASFGSHEQAIGPSIWSLAKLEGFDGEFRSICDWTCDELR